MNSPFSAAMSAIRSNPRLASNPLGAIFSSFLNRQGSAPQASPQGQNWHNGPLSGMRPPQPMAVTGPRSLAYAPPQMMQPQMPQGMDWRQIMARRFPMGFGG